MTTSNNAIQVEYHEMDDIPDVHFYTAYRIYDRRAGQWLERVDKCGRTLWTSEPELGRVYASRNLADTFVQLLDVSFVIVEEVTCSYDRNNYTFAIESSSLAPRHHDRVGFHADGTPFELEY